MTASSTSVQTSSRASRLALGSILVAVVVLALKYVAYLMTGSVALYSDALESIINVAAAVAALIALRVAARPADANHPYGHTKAEYFSAVAEG
ncbi:cation transporter, partial [Deinococcus sp. 23YEL01]|nr:cation transporter [Deinococcus sp. 23YEL01]